MSIATNRTSSAAATLAGVLVAGAMVALTIGVYAGVHEPAGRPLVTLGFSGMLQMKAWLTTGASVLLIVQLTTACGCGAAAGGHLGRATVGRPAASVEWYDGIRAERPGRAALHLGARLRHR